LVSERFESMKPLALLARSNYNQLAMGGLLADRSCRDGFQQSTGMAHGSMLSYWRVG
jgi:hypothetical protein